uniref:Uncharacterized protein n=1 Tax=Anopheles merus TaxID=30066 RepID=A0A182VGQ5_ANOME
MFATKMFATKMFATMMFATKKSATKMFATKNFATKHFATKMFATKLFATKNFATKMFATKKFARIYRHLERATLEQYGARHSDQTGRSRCRLQDVTSNRAAALESICLTTFTGKTNSRMQTQCYSLLEK